ncbi:MAG TPA: VWA domain-containing protein [Kofleriaceae bacterium]|nr:VWA domain-containing protein [Kofleriaceae bacterium]
MRCLLVVAVMFSSRADAEPDNVKPLRVASRLDGHTAELEVHYTLHADPGTTRSFADLPLPDAGVVTGGSVTVDGVRHVLALGDAKQLDDGFTALVEAAREGEPAHEIIVGLAGRSASIDLAVPRATTLEVDLHITTSTCLFHDRRFASVPASWNIGSRDNEVTAGCGAIADSSVWMPFATTELARAPDRVGIVGGRLALGADQLARVELDLAGSLADTPGDLATALVIDVSRSLTPRQVDIQREVVLAYLRLVPRSRVQVIATARTATAMLPGWMPAASVIPRLDRALRGLSLRNGSNVDAGIALAERWLARMPGSHRIIVFSDDRLPQRLLDHAPRASELTHVVELDDRASGLARSDDGPLATLASATTGVAVRAGLRDIDATILVRPIALDDVKIAGEGWTPVDGIGDCNESLDDGHSCTWWGTGTSVSRPIIVEGLLWNRKISRIVQLDPRHATSMARELTLIHPLDEPKMLDVERAAHAMTDHWALGARWGGTGGYAQTEDVGFGRIGTTSGGHSSTTIVDSIAVANAPIVFDLRPQLERAIAGCHVAHHRVVIDLETTRQEIVDVGATISPKLVDPEPPAVLDTIRTCVVEAVWDMTLALPSKLEARIHHVGLGP